MAKQKKRQPAALKSKKVPLAYYRSRGPAASSKSPFQKADSAPGRLSRFFSRVLDLTLIGVVIFCLGYSLIVKADPHISINSSSYHKESVYKDAALKQLQQPKNRNKITLDEQSIISTLQKQFPEIASAYIELPLFSQTPTLHLSIAEPAFLINSNTASYIVDSKGTTVANSRDFPTIKNLPTVIDQTGFVITPGKQVISADGVNFIKTLIVQCQKAGVPIVSLTLPSLPQELDLRTSDRPYYVKFYLGNEPLQQIGQFLATRHQLQVSNIQPAEYLDVRVSGKIFYK